MNPDPALKGVKGGNCNRTACQQPEAHYYNVGTRAYYCWACASDINEFAMRDHADGTKMNLFPTLEADRREQIAKKMQRYVEFTDGQATGTRRSAMLGQAELQELATNLMADTRSLQFTENLSYDTICKEPKQKAQWKRERNGRK